MYKNIKKILAVAMCFAFVVALSACGEEKDDLKKATDILSNYSNILSDIDEGNENNSEEKGQDETNSSTPTPSSSAESSAPTQSSTPTQSSSPSKDESNAQSNVVTPSFKASMDEYEKFFDNYVSFMKKYNQSDNQLDLMTDYADYLSQYNTTMAKFNQIDQSKLSIADVAYYTEVNTRILKKLAEVA